MGIRLDQATALRLAESTGRSSGQIAPRRPASVPTSTETAAAPPSGPAVTPVTAEALQVVVEEINQNLQALQTSLDIIHDDASGRSSVIVRNSDGEVIRQLPPEEVLHAVVQVRRIVGILLDETA